MNRDEKNQQNLDDFWDISDLVPRKSKTFGYARSTDAVELRVSGQGTSPSFSEQTDGENTMIKRYIPPHSEERLTTSLNFDAYDVYTPSDSLIHKVVLKKRKCTYHYYNEFFQDALRYMDRVGENCEYVSFFSYVPQYNQLSDEQLSYYFWFRENARMGKFIKADYSYVLLYVYELINLGERLDVKQTQYILTSIWNEYSKSFPAIAGKLADWICDFSLVHHLPPPINAGSELVHKVPALKEFYIAMPHGDLVGCAQSLLKFCSSYDFHSSKFAKENLELFEKHIFEALLRAVRYYSVDGRLLSGISFDDSKLVRDAYAGALCVAHEKYRIEVEYCSFSRSNELRFLVGDIVKYSENKLRTYLGIKSKMSVYSVSVELREILDAYFAEALPTKRVAKVKEKQAYEVLYDVPVKPFSLSDAAKIEAESWGTTRDLITAFEDEIQMLEEEKKSEPSLVEEMAIPATVEADSDLKSRLGDLYGVVCRLLAGDTNAIEAAARTSGKMSDALADEINELAFDVIGDTLIEEDNDGYRVIEDYRDMLE